MSASLQADSEPKAPAYGFHCEIADSDFAQAVDGVTHKPRGGTADDHQRRSCAGQTRSWRTARGGESGIDRRRQQPARSLKEMHKSQITSADSESALMSVLATADRAINFEHHLT